MSPAAALVLAEPADLFDRETGAAEEQPDPVEWTEE